MAWRTPPDAASVWLSGACIAVVGIVVGATGPGGRRGAAA
jgi:hypothetical protein